VVAWMPALAVLMSASSASAGVDGYRPAPSVATAVTVVNAGFELGATGWSLPEDYAIDPHGGRNGSAALKIVRADPGRYTLAWQTVGLEPGIRYRFGVWVKTEGVRGDESGGTICLEFADAKGWIGGHYPQGVKGTSDWTRIEYVGQTPDQPVACTLTPYLTRGSTGTVWFDDVTIAPEPPSWSAYLILPGQERLDPAGGRIVLGSVLSGRFVPAPGKIEDTDLVCLIRAVAGGRLVAELQAPVRDGRIAAELPATPAGPAALKLTLLEAKHKWTLGECEIPVAVAAPVPPPESACRIDAAGRAMIGGKPFLPVGLYFSGIQRADLDRLAASPFNCVMPYGSFDLRFDRSTRTGIDAVGEVLDICAAKGIKVIFSIKDVYAGTQWAQTEWLGVKGESAVIERAVGAFKGHPALLAWYVNDERPLTMLGRLIERRRLVNRLDPGHPTWSVLDQFDDIPGYGGSYDVLGIDPYPIRDKGSRDMARVFDGLDQSARGIGTADGMPLWVVPQIFSWGMYDCETREEMLRKSRYPTEAEMRAMTLLCALKGARGFVFYSYFDLFRPMAKPDLDRRWAEICRVGRMVRDLEPFLLAPASPVPVEVATERGRVVASRLTDAAGRTVVIVAGIGPGPSRAVFPVDAGKRYISRYGLCTAAGPGRFRFRGTDICADILSEP